MARPSGYILPGVLDEAPEDVFVGFSKFTVSDVLGTYRPSAIVYRERTRANGIQVRDQVTRRIPLRFARSLILGFTALEIRHYDLPKQRAS